MLRLRHALIREGGKTILGDLKTPKSRRSVRLTRAAAEALRGHLERQLEEMERMGSIYQPGGLVFATESGTLINPSNLRNRSFKPLLRRTFGEAGPDICFHDLRHTCATLLLIQGTHPKLVQELLEQFAMSLDYMAPCAHGRLLRRSQKEDSGSRTPARHGQERGCSHLRGES